MEEDDMIMIIVGESADENQLFSIPLKQKPESGLQDAIDVESILQTAETHGEYVSLQDVNQECEYLDSDFNDYEELDDNPTTTKRTSPNTKMPSLKSYVAQLRRDFPNMGKDEDLLVKHLSEVMRKTKPPPPPKEFYHMVLDTYSCSFCFAVNVSLSAAVRHYQDRHGPRYLQCFACGIDYRNTTTLYRHEKRCCSSDAKLVLKARGRYLGRKGRARPYRSLRPFHPGPISPPGYTHRKRLICSQCPAWYRNRNALQAHENTHAGVRPFQCHLCPVAYTYKLALKRHLAQHDSTQFVCDACGRAFKHKPTLVQHLNTHLPRRKFGCERCERRFAQKAALLHHINKVHLKIPSRYLCPACPKSFPRTSNLKTHMIKAHGLTIISRRMFFNALPRMKENMQKYATVVFKNHSDLVNIPFTEVDIFNKDWQPDSKGW